MSEVFQFDTGTILHYTLTEGGLPVNISSATVLTIKFQRKDKTTFSRTGVFETDGTDGKITYTSTASDFDEIGKWYTQAYIEMPNWKGHTSKQSFTILAPILVTP